MADSLRGWKDPDKPTTTVEYEAMKADALKYGTGILGPLEREDRAFLLYQVYKYEAEHELPLTFPVEFTDTELAWWRTI